MLVIIDNGHGYDTKGKCAPDKSLMEWQYTRHVAAELGAALINRGVEVRLLVPEVNDVPLSERVKRVNDLCAKFGANNVLLVSIHVNAAGADGQWHNAGGWCAFTTVGQTRSDIFADMLYAAAERHLAVYAQRMEYGKLSGDYGKVQRPIRRDTTDGDADLESNFYILRNTLCPAVLTENLFQDNKADVEYLLSDEGRQTIVDLHAEAILKYCERYGQ